MFRTNTRHKRTFCEDVTTDAWTHSRNEKTHKLYCMSQNVEPTQEIPRLESRHQIDIFKNPNSELLRNN